MTHAATGRPPSTGTGRRSRGERDRLAFLAEVSDALIRSLDAGETADLLARLTVPRLADWTTVTVLGDDGGEPRTARAHRDPDRLEDLDTYLDGRLGGARDRPALMAALLSGQPVQLTSVDAELAPSLPIGPVRTAWERLAASSVVLLPLTAHGETIGALSLVNAGDRPPLTPAEIETAVEVARRGGLALDNARLYGRQLKVAETLQRSLLTAPPRTDALDIAVRYRPASRHSVVGGDFYDAFLQPDGAMLLVVGDVAGHSVEATAAMSELRSTVRALAYDHGEDGPGATLQRTDRALTGLGFDTLATALVASLARSSSPGGTGPWTLRWSSAGHPPPLLLHADGGVGVLERPAERLLGTGALTPRSDHLLELGPGDTLVLYTDGLLEHQRTGIDEGLQRLSSVLAGLADRSAAEICDEVLDRVVTGPAADDIALLVVRPR